MRRKEKIAEVINKVKEKISEIDSETEDLNAGIKEINETLNPPSEPEAIPEPEAEPENNGSPVKYEAADKESVLKSKIIEKEEQRGKLEDKKREKESERDNAVKDGAVSQINAQIQIIEQQKSKLDETAAIIEAKINDENINEATRERLEEMQEEVGEKIDELDEKIDELQDKKDEYTDQINDEIDEISDQIDEINDEIEELEEEIEDLNQTVDEDVIDEVKKSSGFEDLGSLLNRITETVSSALSNIQIPDIKIPPIPEINIKIPKFNEKTEQKENKGEVSLDDIIAIAPFAKKETLDKLADKLAATEDFSKIHALAPFLSQDSLVKLIEKNGKVDMNLLKSLAPFLGADYIDEIISKIL